MERGNYFSFPTGSTDLKLSDIDHGYQISIYVILS